MKTTQLKVLSFLCLTYFLTLASPPVQAQTVDQILEKHIDVYGFRQLKDKKNIKIVVEAEVMGRKFPSTIFRQGKDKLRVEIEMMGATRINVFNKEGAFAIDAKGQKTPLTETVAKQVKASTYNLESAFVDYKENGDTINRLDDQEVNGIECFVLKHFEKKKEESSVHFINKENYRLVRTETITNGASVSADAISHITIFDNYVTIGKMILRVGDKELGVVEVLEVKFDQKFPDGFFQ